MSGSLRGRRNQASGVEDRTYEQIDRTCRGLEAQGGAPTGRNVAAGSTNPGNPSMAVPALPSSLTWGLLRRVLDTAILRPQAQRFMTKSPIDTSRTIPLARAIMKSGKGD